MDASKKQREPVAFKSLAELKRFIRPGVEFKTVSHANHADMVGLTRVVTTVQTVGFYSKIKDQPEHPFSTCNHGKGFYTDFGKAGNYIFDGTTVKVKDARKQDCGVIYELEFYDREQNMEETMMDRKMADFIKEQYPPGTRIRLNSMEDPYAPIAPGTEGEVDFVDDIGTIHMKWDNGRSLALIPGEDSFTVLPPKLASLKLYMPLTADLYERNEYGDLDDSSTLLEGSELRGYQDQITAALVKNRMPEETERGLMHWYDEADSVDRKVRSAVFTVEKRDRQLWGVAECRIAGELSDTEMDTLKEFITGQASDGWGEGFEQREISVDDGGELYVHFWNSDEWSIQTEQELFSPKLADGLPELCFSTLPGTGELICIKRGESGYYAGNALLQKRYTTATLPKRQKINHGEREMYYVADSNEAIIPQELFDRAKELRQRRSVGQAVTHGRLCVRMRCSCGSRIRAKRVNGRWYWCCCRHDTKGDCAIKPVPEAQTDEAFRRLYYKLKHQSLPILEQMLETLQTIRDRRLLWSEDIVSLNKKISELSSQNQTLAFLKQNGLVDPDIFISKSNELTRQLRQAKLDKEKLMAAEGDATAHRTRELIALLEDGPDFLDRPDTELCGALVAEIIVESNDTLRFRLHNGLELRESIERTVR